MKHELFACPPGRCPAEETGRSCRYCDGGLSYCTVCRGAEGSLPTECPGTPMTDVVEQQVYSGKIDFRDGKWVRIDF